MGNATPPVVTNMPAPTKTLVTDAVAPAPPSATTGTKLAVTAAIPPTEASGVAPSTTTSPQASACLPRTNWSEYQVQRGDHLTRIAAITGSTVDELIAANCLENPNALRAGQMLYVPRVPQTPTPRPSATPR